MRYLAWVTTLGLKELRVLGRDRQAAALLFVMPAVFVFLLSLALGDIYAAKVGVRLPIALAVEDEGAPAQRFVEMLAARGEVELLDWEAGSDAAELFRSQRARATVRIPAGFSEAIEAFVESHGEAALGEARIEWAVSPTMDAVYRSVVRAMLTLGCVRVVQDELAATTGELAQEMQGLAQQLARLAQSLEQAVGQLESTARQLDGTREEVEAFAAAALAERAANEEAQRAREAFLASQGSAEEAAWAEADLESAAVETRLIGVEAGDFEALTPEEKRELEGLLRRADERSAKAGDQAEWTLSDASFLSAGGDGGDELELPSPLQQSVPGWSLFAMFFIVVPLSSALHRERNEGTIRRIRSLGTPRSAILLGKVLPYVGIGMLQFGAMLLVGVFAVPLVSELTLELGRHPWVLLPITTASAFAATGYGLLVASLAKTPERAAAFGATSIIILSLLGGVMIPHFIMPPALQSAALLSPIYWGQRAYLDVFLHGADLAGVGSSLYALLAFGALCLAASAARIGSPR